jgi:tetratricopeptide (TPR) repeat protein
VFSNDFTSERKGQAFEDPSFPIVDYVAAIKADEKSEQQIPTESESLIETILGSSSEDSMGVLSIESEQNSFTQDEENESLFTLTPEEKTDIRENDRIGLNVDEGLTTVEYKDISVEVSNELSREETISDWKNDAHNPVKTDTEEKPTSVPEDKTFRVHEEKKARANSFTEEYLKSREMISEQTKKMKKKQLVWLGISFISLFVLTVAGVIYFFSGTINTLNNNKPPIVISRSNDNNSSDSVINEAISDNANSSISDNERFDGIVDAIKDSIKLNTVVASVLEQSNRDAESTDSSLVSEDSAAKTIAQSIASSDSVNLDTIIVGNISDKGEPIQKGTSSGTMQASAQAGNTTSAIRKTTVDPARTIEKPIARSNRQSMGSPARSARADSPVRIDLTKDRIFSAIKDERYTEAIELSKSNLEKNTSDRLSFFFLGVAFYASSDYTGATRAFYACLNLDSPSLPDFLVEEFDSIESLENLFINYPGVDLLIRSVELNPQDKSLYLNLLLSNLKSEKPMETSVIYNAVLNHAQKRLLNATKLN